MGGWITGYTIKAASLPRRTKARQLSVAGIITAMLPRSIVDNGRYDEDDFARRQEEELFPQLVGKPMSGPADTSASRSAEANLYIKNSLLSR